MCMPQNKAIHTIYNIAKLFATVDRSARRPAPSCPVGDNKSICWIFPSATFDVTKPSPEKSHILTIQMLQIQLAHNVICGVIVCVFPASPFMISRASAKNAIFDWAEHFCHNPLLFPWSHRFFIDVCDTRFQGIVQHITAKDDITVRLF